MSAAARARSQIACAVNSAARVFNYSIIWRDSGASGEPSIALISFISKRSAGSGTGPVSECRKPRTVAGRTGFNTKSMPVYRRPRRHCNWVRSRRVRRRLRRLAIARTDLILSGIESPQAVLTKIVGFDGT